MFDVKFRAKIIEKGERFGKWAYGGYTKVETSDGIRGFITEENLKIVEVDIYTVGMCTYREDKNRKLIYEGDIIREPQPNKYWAKGFEYVVQWEPCRTGFIFARPSSVNEFRGIDFSEYTIVGNVHDNPRP